MSVEAMAVVLHHSRARGTDKLVLLGIANHSGDGGAWPTIETLARYANVEDRSVQRALSALVKLGELSIRPNAGGDFRTPPGQRPNRYDVLVSCPATCDHSMNHRHIPLPTTQSDLWITGVTPTSGGDASVTPGVTPTSPGGVTPTSPKPSLEPTTHYVVEDVTVPHEPSSMPDCSICTRSFEDCSQRQHLSGHTYSPKKRTLAQVVGPVLENYDDLRAGA